MHFSIKTQHCNQAVLLIDLQQCPQWLNLTRDNKGADRDSVKNPLTDLYCLMAYMVIWSNPTAHTGLHAAMQEQHVPALTDHSPWSPIWAEWNSQVTSWSCTLFHLSLFYSLSHTLMHTHTAPSSSSFLCSFPSPSYLSVTAHSLTQQWAV